jgi:hypothetical protein
MWPLVNNGGLALLIPIINGASVQITGSRQSSRENEILLPVHGLPIIFRHWIAIDSGYSTPCDLDCVPLLNLEERCHRLMRKSYVLNRNGILHPIT